MPPHLGRRERISYGPERAPQRYLQRRHVSSGPGREGRSSIVLFTEIEHAERDLDGADGDHQECPRDRNTADKERTLHDYIEEQGCPGHAMDVRAVDDLLPQAQSCPLMLMLHASNLFMFCMDKKSDAHAKKRRDDDILSAVLYEQKELQLPRWKQQTTAKGRTTRTEGCRFCSG